MLRIAIVGPESSGKTTLCEALAQHYQCAYTKEYARGYLEDHGPGYTEDDLIHIARGQLLVEGQAQELAVKHGGDLMICDTDMITIRIWSKEKFGRCHQLIAELADTVQYDLWLLCEPDFPWEPDPLREDPHDRERLFTVYKAALDHRKGKYVMIRGDRAARLHTAKAAIGELIA
jgi:NadR type nicotinamide-nucleotide adenylyltransferase